MNKFYDKIIDNSRELSQAFEELSSNFTSKEWAATQEQFHKEIEKEFPTISCQITLDLTEEKNPIPERISKRIKVAAMLLNILAMGGKYSRSLYLKTLDFCTTTEVKNGSFVS